MGINISILMIHIPSLCPSRLSLITLLFLFDLNKLYVVQDVSFATDLINHRAIISFPSK